MSPAQRLFDPQRIVNSATVRVILPVVAIAAVLFANFYIFTVVPNEAVMGPVQRIFYFHVSSAISCYVMIAILLIASVLYLRTFNPAWDLIATAATKVAFLLSSCVLTSGMIWGHSAWNTWWRWEPRLVSFLIMWLIFLSYLLLRSFTQNDHRQGRFCAVLAILAAVNIPIVIFSVKFLDKAQQLHPQVMEERGLKDEHFVYGLVISMVAVVLISIWLFLLKLHQGVLEARIQRLEMNTGGMS